MKRSDNFPIEPNTESDTYSEIDNRVTISEPSNEYSSVEVSTDEKTDSQGSYDYYSNDSTEDMVHSS